MKKKYIIELTCGATVVYCRGNSEPKTARRLKMKEVIIEEEEKSTINLSDLDPNHPIFVKKHDKFYGLLVKEKEGWIVRVGGICGSHGYHETREKCLKGGLGFGYTYFIEG